MQIIYNFFNDFKTKYTIDDKLIVILAVSLFSHYVITGIVIVGIALFALFKRDLISKMKNMTSAYALLGFAVYLLIISLINQNWLGALISVGMFLVFITIIYYRQHIHKKLFETILNLMIIMSIICVIISFFEQLYFVNILDTSNNFFDISNKPAERVHVWFFNANYYAMMILFAEAFCVYKMIDKKKNRKLYILAALANLLALFLTGSRLVWVCLFLTWLVMFIVSWKKPAIIATLAFGITTIASTLLKLPLIPRLLEYGISLGRRQVIFEAASIMMKDTWLFGQGPLTYFYRNKDYLDDYIVKYGSEDLGKLGISSQHVHSMFLEPFISFGVVGSAFLIVYLFAQFRRIWHIYEYKIDRSLITLIIGSVVAVVTANTIDFSIFWIQTGPLFLLILGSVDIYRDRFIEFKKQKKLNK